jgi:hypothetical protein
MVTSVQSALPYGCTLEASPKNKKKEGVQAKDNKVLGFHTIKLLTSSYVIFHLYLSVK